MTITLQNMSLCRNEIIQRQQTELDEYWKAFFEEIAKVMQSDAGIKSLSIGLNETHDGTVYVSTIDVDAAPDNETAETLIKIVNTNMDAFLHDYYRLDCDDTIKVTASGVEGRFRRYGNWNIEILASDSLGL